jgi:hypothetical protein
MVVEGIVAVPTVFRAAPTSATAAEGRDRGHPRTACHGRRDRPATGGTG